MTMFQNRKLINKVMYVLAIIIVATMVLLTIGPSVFQ